MQVNEVSAPGTDGIADALETHFGFRELRGGQHEVVESILSGRDTMAIMPTGAGKSLCFQLPALMREGVTLVVSPLIALMKDQVDGLVNRGIAATLINSTLSPQEQQSRLQQISEGAYKLVYVAPERFRSRSFVETLRSVKISLFAVDEAHCLSQWGHDFRPDYLRLSQAVEALGRPQTAAFTATATPEVQADIQKVLALQDPFVTVSGFARPNLSLSVIHCAGNREKYDRLERLIQSHRTGIIYCSTRKKVEEVAASLHASKVKLVAYHGGMEDRDRAWAQKVFLDRTYDVVVATNAFGMGIDRADVRFVAHFDIPGSMEAYYQEAGRAGRDGEPSVCELLFNYADTRTQEFFIEGNNPEPSLICDIYRTLLQSAGPDNEAITVTIKDLASMVNVKNTMQVSSAISHLLRAGHIERFDVPGSRTRGTRITDISVPDSQLNINYQALQEKERRDRSKLDAMIRFCYDEDTCRQVSILNYFGEPDARSCGCCDICDSSSASDRRPPTETEFLAVQKALSGVARTCGKMPSGEWEPRFGKGKIVQMLVGSHAQEVVQARLDQLSTFGLLSDYGTNYVYNLLNEMEKVGLIQTRKTPYPLVAITKRGAEVMRGDNGFRLAWPSTQPSPKERRKSQTKGDFLSPEELEAFELDEELYEKLKDIRTDLAAKAGNVPAYVIFSNQTLEHLARVKPANESEALRIKGIGKLKAERYLTPFIEEISGQQGG